MIRSGPGFAAGIPGILGTHGRAMVAFAAGIAWMAAASSGRAAGEPRLPGWKHAASLWVLTTSNGVPLPRGAVVRGFPLLVRLAAPAFDFAAARPSGEDLRFTTAQGEPLPHEVEAWDAPAGRASVWVRMPEVRGDDQQELRVHWGHPDAPAVSDGKAVFTPADGHVGVWHLGADLRDVVRGGELEARDARLVEGVAGGARRPGPGGMAAPGTLQGHALGAGPSTTEAWVRVERPNGTVIGWGREAAQGKVVLQVRSPAHGRVDAYFSNANVEGSRRIAAGEWTHVVHAYEDGVARLYINGELDATGPGRASALSIKAPSRLWLGCWHGHDVFEGDIDEARLAAVARSPDWIRLSHGNQKPMQELAGHLVTEGNAWGVTPSRLKVQEGGRALLRASAGGARRVW